jgi:hypothetical protein
MYIIEDLLPEVSETQHENCRLRSNLEPCLATEPAFRADHSDSITIIAELKIKDPHGERSCDSMGHVEK